MRRAARPDPFGGRVPRSPGDESRYGTARHPSGRVGRIDTTAALALRSLIDDARNAGLLNLDKPTVRFAGNSLKPSDGLEPSTPSLPWNLSGNRLQPTATVCACPSRFRGRPICHRLRLVATAGRLRPAVRKSDATHVEQHEPREGGKPFEEPRPRSVFPHDLDVRPDPVAYRRSTGPSPTTW
jgi:hypothetical protein